MSFLYCLILDCVCFQREELLRESYERELQAKDELNQQKDQEAQVSSII